MRVSDTNKAPLVADRKAWLSLLAKAPAAQLAKLWSDLGSIPEYSVLRAPEIGSVMVRGRAGATGAPFNIGETTVTRCSVCLASGENGHGYVQGRHREKALQVALIDALMQTEAAEQVRKVILAPLEVELQTAKARRAAKAAATKVDFFTLVRGED